jgi:hypothetical protein
MNRPEAGNSVARHPDRPLPCIRLLVQRMEFPRHVILGRLTAQLNSNEISRIYAAAVTGMTGANRRIIVVFTLWIAFGLIVP